MLEMGLPCDKHHHEVAAAQHELGLTFGTLTATADRMQIYKYVVHQIAHAYGKTATFMRSEEHTSEFQSLMSISYAVFCMTTKKNTKSYVLSHVTTQINTSTYTNQKNKTKHTINK